MGTARGMVVVARSSSSMASPLLKPPFASTSESESPVTSASDPESSTASESEGTSRSESSCSSVVAIAALYRNDRRTREASAFFRARRGRKARGRAGR